MFGRHPKLPIDLILGEEGEKLDQEKYAKNWEQQMREAYQIVRERSLTRKQKDINRRKNDGKKILGDLVVGDRVLVKNVRERGGPGKLRSYWEQKVYVVTEKKSEVVYTVIEEGSVDDTKKRVLHRNMFLPVNQWFIFEKTESSQPCRAKKKQKVLVCEDDYVPAYKSDDIESEDGEWFAIVPNHERGELIQPFLNEEEDDGVGHDTDADTNTGSTSDSDATIDHDMDEEDEATKAYEEEEA